MWTVDYYNNRGRRWQIKEFVPSDSRERDNAFTRLSVSSFRGVAFRERDQFVVRGAEGSNPPPPPASLSHRCPPWPPGAKARLSPGA
jgi:hypothetical protein